MIYVYLHGFNSAYDPNSGKVQSLSLIGDVHGVTYNTFGTYEEIIDEISAQVSFSDDLVFVGTSLGGFWAAEMGRRFSVPSVIINPCTDPRTMLQKYVGAVETNYINGDVNTLTSKSANSYPGSGISRAGRYLPLVLLDMGDEVIDSFQTREDLKDFPMACWEGGSHRFEHTNEALDDIRNYINHCSYVENLD
jgi:uncharacterized protein